MYPTPSAALLLFSTIFLHLPWHLSAPQPNPSSPPQLILCLLVSLFIYVVKLFFFLNLLPILLPHSSPDDFASVVKVTLPRRPIKISTETALAGWCLRRLREKRKGGKGKEKRKHWERNSMRAISPYEHGLIIASYSLSSLYIKIIVSLSVSSLTQGKTWTAPIKTKWI